MQAKAPDPPLPSIISRKRSELRRRAERAVLLGQMPGHSAELLAELGVADEAAQCAAERSC
jgi:hypothetical protein